MKSYRELTLILMSVVCMAFSTAAQMNPRAGWEYFMSFQQAARDFAQLSQTKLTMPVLAIGGDKANGKLLGEQMRLVAENSTTIVLKNCGHWLMEEQPKGTMDALLNFLYVNGLGPKR